MRNITIAITLTVTLMACTHSVERLTRDNELRHALIKECIQLGIKAKDKQNCINAASAQAKVAGSSINKLKEFIQQ